MSDKRRAGCPPGFRKPSDPTPKQIKDACLRIQAGWDDETRRKRTVQVVEAIETQIVVLDHLVLQD